MKYVKTHGMVKASEKGVFGESKPAAVNKYHAPAEQAVNNSMPMGAAPSIPMGWGKGSKVKHTKHQK